MYLQFTSHSLGVSECVWRSHLLTRIQQFVVSVRRFARFCAAPSANSAPFPADATAVPHTHTPSSPSPFFKDPLFFDEEGGGEERNRLKNDRSDREPRMERGASPEIPKPPTTDIRRSQAATRILLLSFCCSTGRQSCT